MTEIAMTERPMRERKSPGSRIMICVVPMCDTKVGVHVHRGGKVYAEVSPRVSIGSQNRAGGVGVVVVWEAQSMWAPQVMMV